VPDPYMFGGGLHFTDSGGKLAVHADFNRHPKLNLDRRLNVLIYLNEGWTDDNQGWLELWDREMRNRVTRVSPVFNRTVMFSTTSFSFHGQPEPIIGPPDLVRRSIALYYYTNGRPAAEITDPDHSTLWQSRPADGY
jgi:Rps23 Pro-64 3,4-dihydroxylase Tpa1-like proline 4-hydroxylase